MLNLLADIFSIYFNINSYRNVVLLVAFLAVKVAVDTLGQLGPVGVKAAFPAGAVPRKQPIGVNRIWSETFAPKRTRDGVLDQFQDSTKQVKNVLDFII